MELTAHQIDRLKIKIATTLYYFENYLDKNVNPKTSDEYNKLEENAIAFYERDSMFWHKVNMMTNILWNTLKEKDVSD